jgi:hypothetical protein
MTNINVSLKDVELKAKELGSDLEVYNRELKRLSSIKCRLNKQMFRPGTEEKIVEVLKEYELVRKAKSLVFEKDKPVTEYEQSDIDILTYDETEKALKSIQSKKYHTRWLTEVDGDNDEFRKACEIERMLNEHKKNVKPITDNVVRKSDIARLIETIESTPDMTVETILSKLYELNK